MALRVFAALVLCCAVAHAQTPADTLREGNTAAAQGDWKKVTDLVAPLLQGQLSAADLGEAHRLAGIAAFFQNDRASAEYLKIELDGRLDPALYPPEVVNFFNDVRTRHEPEIRDRRPKSKRYWYANLVPPFGQIQNGDKKKAIVIGSLIGAFAITNVTTFLVLRSWCTEVNGSNGSSVTCDSGGDHSSSAAALRVVNIASGIGLILTYGFGVYDGVKGYRRNESPQPFVAPASGGGVVGVFGSF
jgi:hypothetical protein